MNRLQANGPHDVVFGRPVSRRSTIGDSLARSSSGPSITVPASRSIVHRCRKRRREPLGGAVRPQLVMADHVEGDDRPVLVRVDRVEHEARLAVEPPCRIGRGGAVEYAEPTLAPAVEPVRQARIVGSEHHGKVREQR